MGNKFVKVLSVKFILFKKEMSSHLEDFKNRFTKIEKNLEKLHTKQIELEDILEVDYDLIIEAVKKQIPRVQNGKDGKNGENGKDAVVDYDSIIKKCLTQIKIPQNEPIDYNKIIKLITEKVIKELQITPQSIRDALMDLTGESRLDASAIKNLPRPINHFQGGGGGVWGGITGDILQQGDLQSALNNKINLDGTNSNIDYLNFLPYNNPPYQEGRVWYDTNSRSLSYYDNFRGTSVQVGKELVLDARNNSGTNILNGQVVYISGALGQNPTIALARADSLTTSEIIGVATHNIDNNTTGKVTIIGIVNDIDTSSFTDGQQVYLSSTTAGALTSTPPASPNFVVFVGHIAHAHPTQGKLSVASDRAMANNNALGTSQTVFPSQNSVKQYVDTNLLNKQNRLLNVVNVNTNYTILSTDDLIQVDTTNGNITISLPTASSVAGMHFYITKSTSDSNQVIIDPNGSELIIGDLILGIENQYDTAHIVSNGSGWIIL